MYHEIDGFIVCDCAFVNRVNTFHPEKDCIVDSLIEKKQEEIETLIALQKVLQGGD